MRETKEEKQEVPMTNLKLNLAQTGLKEKEVNVRKILPVTGM